MIGTQTVGLCYWLALADPIRCSQKPSHGKGWDDFELDAGKIILGGPGVVGALIEASTTQQYDVKTLPDCVSLSLSLSVRLSVWLAGWYPACLPACLSVCGQM